MGIVIGMVGIGLLFFFSMFIGGVIFLLGLGLEILHELANAEGDLQKRGLKERFANWKEDKNTEDYIILGIEIVTAVIVGYFLLADIIENI